jgi:hypothetical protein
VFVLAILNFVVDKFYMSPCYSWVVIWYSFSEPCYSVYKHVTITHLLLVNSHYGYNDINAFLILMMIIYADEGIYIFVWNGFFMWGFIPYYQNYFTKFEKLIDEFLWQSVWMCQNIISYVIWDILYHYIIDWRINLMWGCHLKIFFK